jgi:hypothetical protein
MAESWRAKERTTTWLDGFDAGWLPDDVRGRIRTILRRSGEVGLEIEGWVGSVSLRNGDNLLIGSKFGDADFMRILLRVQGIRDYGIDPSLYAYSDSPSPLRFVASSFVTTLRNIHAQGRAFGWMGMPTTSATRPTFTDLRRTSIRILQRKDDPFIGSNQYRSTDLPEHRVLSLAATFVLADEVAGHLPDSSRALLLAWKRRAWSRTTIVEDLRHVQSGLVVGRYSGARGYYVDALRLATVILGLNGLAIWGVVDTSAAAFLINSDLLFEKYIRAVLFDSYRASGLTFEKERPNNAFLFVDGTVSMEPDILVLRGTDVICIGDVKHKEPNASDYYQLFTYLRQYGLGRGFLVQATENAAARTLKLLTRRDRTEVFVVPVPINDLDELEARVSNIDAEVGF